MRGKLAKQLRKLAMATATGGNRYIREDTGEIRVIGTWGCIDK